MKEWLERLWNKICKPFRVVRRFFRNLIFWMPILWTDRWFDSSYLMRIIERKCRRDAYMYYLHGHCADNKNVAYELMDVSECCRRLQEDEYFEPAYTKHVEKWGWNPIISSMYEGKSIFTAEQLAQERAEFKVIADAAYAAEKADVELLSKLFLNIKTWWD